MSPLVVVVLIVLVDLLGFSIVMPLLAPFGREYGFSGGQIGLLLAAYPLAQLVAGPILGRLSDRYGRRPVLAASQGGTAVSFLILGLATDFPTMLLARLIDGASGGNILVAQAYVADVTKPADRARGYGLIGMAFGVGFVLGPILSAGLVSLPLPPDWRLRIPFLVAGLFSTIAWILVLTRLPESLPADRRDLQPARVASWRGLAETFARPEAGRLIVLGSLVTVAFAALEGTFSLFLEQRLGWTTRGVLGGFAFIGLVGAATQGGLLRRLVPRYGESRLIVAGLVLLALGFAGLGAATSTLAVLGATLLVGVGQGLATPSVNGLLSRATPGQAQGAAFGTLSAAQTLARLLIYVGANVVFGRGNLVAPFWGAAGVSLVALALAALALPAIDRRVRDDEAGTGGTSSVPTVAMSADPA